MNKHPLIITTARTTGRLTFAQKKAIKESSLLVDKINIREKTVLEIGFGNGDFLCKMAQLHPDMHFIGVDIYMPGVGATLVKANNLGLDNIEIVHGDIRLIQEDIPDYSLERIHILFSDPWPKKRNHKRRLINHNQIQYWLTKIRPEGSLFIATDDSSYQEYIEQEISSSNIKLIKPKHFMPNCHTRPKTKYESRGIKLGHTIKEWHIQKLSRIITA